MAFRLSMPKINMSSGLKPTAPKLTMPKTPKAPKPFMPRQRRYTPALQKRNF